ncbi:MAG: hypothetical protein PHS42_08185 [Sulfurimonas sp.]|nr:hypothetical protein [Sulfurimonas sp.]MDD3835438.1 hypothetical protein [Sulfurimonas sp.]
MTYKLIKNLSTFLQDFTLLSLEIQHIFLKAISSFACITYEAINFSLMQLTLDTIVRASPV